MDWTADGCAAPGSQSQAGWLQLQGWRPSCRRERSQGQGEQLLYSAYLPLPADSARFGLAQGSVHYLLIFTTLVPQFTSKFFLGFLAEIPGKKNLVEAIFVRQAIHNS